MILWRRNPKIWMLLDFSIPYRKYKPSYFFLWMLQSWRNFDKSARKGLKTVWLKNWRWIMVTSAVEQSRRIHQTFLEPLLLNNGRLLWSRSHRSIQRSPKRFQRNRLVRFHLWRKGIHIFFTFSIDFYFYGSESSFSHYPFLHDSDQPYSFLEKKLSSSVKVTMVLMVSLTCSMTLKSSMPTSESLLVTRNLVEVSFYNSSLLCFLSLTRIPSLTVLAKFVQLTWVGQQVILFLQLDSSSVLVSSVIQFSLLRLQFLLRPVFLSTLLMSERFSGTMLLPSMPMTNLTLILTISKLVLSRLWEPTMYFLIFLIVS